MLPYMTYKKVKKNRAEKAAREEAEKLGESSKDARRRRESIDDANPEEPILNAADEEFLQKLLSDEGPRPALPPRMKTPDVDWVSDLDASSTTGPSQAEPEPLKGNKKTLLKEKEKDKDGKQGRISALWSKVRKDRELIVANAKDGEREEKQEESDVTKILNRLNLSTKNNKVIPTSEDSSDLLNRFTLIFKDLANGVPTAYNDLVKLIEDRDGTINKGYQKLPKSLQKLVMQLPDKVTSALGPEVLLAAAHAGGLQADKGKSMKDQAGKIFVPANIMQLVTKPGAVIGMLKAIVNALRLRWPAFIGLNVIWSVALFLLMFVLWYCYKRGREERLLKEGAGEPVDGADRIEELPDDLMIEAPPSRRGTSRESDHHSSAGEGRSRRHKDRSRPSDHERRRTWDSDEYPSSGDDRSRRHEERRYEERSRPSRHTRTQTMDSEDYSVNGESRTRRDEYRREDEMTRREQRLRQREEELARREEEMYRSGSRRYK